MPLLGCPTCQKAIDVAEENLGKMIRCSACHSLFQAPGGKAPRPAPTGSALEPVDPIPEEGIAAETTWQGQERPRPRREKARVSPAELGGTDRDDPRLVRSRPQAPVPLRRVAWLIRAGSGFGLLALLFLCGLEGYDISQKGPPNWAIITFVVFSLVSVVLVTVGSFHFHPRRSYGFALLTALASLICGLVNVLGWPCCGLTAVWMATAPRHSGKPIGAVFLVIFVVAVLPATLLLLIGGGLGLRELFKPEVKRLYLD
jgi:hypothetical protein